MIQATQIREHMEVVGSDGGHVGRVDHVLGTDIELAKMDLGSGLKHHLIPMTWVDRVEDDKVCLNMTKDAAKAGDLARMRAEAAEALAKAEEEWLEVSGEIEAAA